MAEEKVLIATRKIEQAIEEAVNRVVKEYVAFDDKLHEAGVESYNHGLADCLRKVKKFYPDLDTSKIEEDFDKEDSDEENQVGEPIIDQIEEAVGNQTQESAPDSQTLKETSIVFTINQVEAEESMIERNVNDQ